MDETLWYKFTQHANLKEELLATGDAELVEVRGITQQGSIGTDGISGFGQRRILGSRI
jgi:diaminohydroxyphosphoribosylaminopyrimidine deaminase/5-amino-6-(5-phosphoribosylamino)uracil reductase